MKCHKDFYISGSNAVPEYDILFHTITIYKRKIILTFKTKEKTKELITGKLIDFVCLVTFMESKLRDRLVAC